MDVENGTYRCIIYIIVFIYYRHYKITRTMTNNHIIKSVTIYAPYIYNTPTQYAVLT